MAATTLASVVGAAAGTAFGSRMGEGFLWRPNGLLSAKEHAHREGCTAGQPSERVTSACQAPPGRTAGARNATACRESEAERVHVQGDRVLVGGIDDQRPPGPDRRCLIVSYNPG